MIRALMKRKTLMRNIRLKPFLKIRKRKKYMKSRSNLFKVSHMRKRNIPNLSKNLRKVKRPSLPKWPIPLKLKCKHQ